MSSGTRSSARGFGRRGIAALFAAAALAAFCWTAVPTPAAPVAGKSVIGGRLASISEFPYAAVVLKDGKAHCSGAVISPTRVLTAGHCAKPPASRLSVLTGTDRARGGTGQVLGVVAATRHPDYIEDRKRGVIHNDIAVLALAGSTAAPAIALPPPGQDPILTAPGDSLTLAAYGERSPTLLKKSRIGRLAAAELAVRGNCAGLVPRFSPETMICAQGRKVGVARSGRKRRGVHSSGCFGDSGGPLVGQTGSGSAVFGVTSGGGASPKGFFFVLCGLKRKPGLYTRVAAYVPWIQSNL